MVKTQKGRGVYEVGEAGGVEEVERLLQVMTEWAKLLRVARRQERRMKMRTEWEVLGVGRGSGRCR